MVIKVLTKGNENRVQSEIVSKEELMPKDHLLRKAEAAVDFTKTYGIVEDLYCKNNGRQSQILSYCSRRQ